MIYLRIRHSREESSPGCFLTFCFVTDVTKQKREDEELRRREQQLYIQAIRDPLTDLFNYRYMEETLYRELSRAKRRKYGLGIMMLDLDHFKRFNDTYGHGGGNELLRSFARLLKRQVREEDVVCRYGGEEFVIIMPDAIQEVVISRAESIKRTTANLRPHFRRRVMDPVTVSIGVSFFPGHGILDERQMIAAADVAMYRAKQKGRNRVEVAEQSA